MTQKQKVCPGSGQLGPHAPTAGALGAGGGEPQFTAAHDPDVPCH